MLQQIATSGMPQHAGVFQHVDVRKRLFGQQQEMLKPATRSSYKRDMRVMRATANAQGPQPRCEKMQVFQGSLRATRRPAVQQ